MCLKTPVFVLRSLIQIIFDYSHANDGEHKEAFDKLPVTACIQNTPANVCIRCRRTFTFTIIVKFILLHRIISLSRHGERIRLSPVKTSYQQPACHSLDLQTSPSQYSSQCLGHTCAGIPGTLHRQTHSSYNFSHVNRTLTPETHAAYLPWYE